MFHKTVLMIVFSFAVGLVGCRSCWGPYDRCQPTFVPEAGDQCMGELYRNGSVLGGMERRGNCGGCSACASGVAEADYGYLSDAAYDYGSDASYAAPGNLSNYSEAGTTQPLPNTANAPASGGNSEVIPTPDPNTIPNPLPGGADPDKASIKDFLPDVGLPGEI